MKTSIIDTPLYGKTEHDLFDIKGYQDALIEFIKYAEAPAYNCIARRMGWWQNIFDECSQNRINSRRYTVLCHRSKHLALFHALYSRPGYRRDFTQYP